MNVDQIMSGHPVWVKPETDVVSAALRMSEHGFGALPVCDRGQLVGIVTDRDIVVRYFGRGANEGRLVAHYMTRDPVTIEPEQPLEQAEQLMSEHHIRRIPVCKEGRLVGMIAQGDLARYTSRDRHEQLASV